MESALPGCVVGSEVGANLDHSLIAGYDWGWRFCLEAACWEARNDFKGSGWAGMRWLLWMMAAASFCISLLGLLGLVRADELYGRTQLVERQMVWLLLAVPVMAAAALVPYRLLRPWSMPLYGLTLLLLAVVLFMPPINGSRRWIPLGLFDLQASEPARLAFVLALAAWLMHRRSQQSLRGLAIPVCMAAVPMLLIIREPDLDTALLFVPVLGGMLYAAGARAWHLGAALVFGAACLPLLWMQMSAEQQSRVVSVFVQRDGGPAPAGDGFHLHQSKQVLALGGLGGSLLQDEPPTDDSAAWQLPAARTDFIFVMIGERFGLAGCGVLLGLYGFLIIAGLVIAGSCTEPWGRLVAVGITVLLGVQVILNTGMTVGLLPITGTALPLCSYGGSSLLCTYASMGLLINIRIHQTLEATGRPFWS
ncbi:MAG: Cell division protein FtsW [Planctomycetota bacterium]